MMRGSLVWKIYFWLYTALGLIGIPTVIQLKLPLQILRATILWFPAVLGMYLFIWGKAKRFLLFWRLYFLYYIIDTIYEWFWLRFFFTVKIKMPISVVSIVYAFEIIVLLPSMVALYLYAFKSN